MPRLGASAELATLVIEASSKTLESNQLPLWLPPFGDVVTTPSSCCQESPFCPKARNSGFAVGWPMSRLVRTPGACTIIDCRPARPVGISSSVSLVSCVRVDVAATSTIGASPDTVTVSASVPTFSAMSIRAVNPAVSLMSWRRSVPKPASSYCTA